MLRGPTLLAEAASYGCADGEPAPTGIERTTYIAAVQEEWDYIPSGVDQCTGEDFDDDTVSLPICIPQAS